MSVRRECDRAPNHALGRAGHGTECLGPGLPRCSFVGSVQRVVALQGACASSAHAKLDSVNVVLSCNTHALSVALLTDHWRETLRHRALVQDFEDDRVLDHRFFGATRDRRLRPCGLSLVVCDLGA